jgi:soluble lytic murein transglycosylase-like protein
MSRKKLIDSLVLTALIAASCMVAPAAARADVLEIGAGGATWIAGGPPAEPAGAAQSGQGSAAPLSHAPDSAGPQQWRGHVAYLAAKYDVSPRLIEAMVWQESRWRTNALSPAGARGLAQLMPGTARDLGVNPDDPVANLEGGVRYLRQQLDTFDGDVEKALAAYNAGPARVARAGGVPNIRETQNYVATIMARLAQPARR